MKTFKLLTGLFVGLVLASPVAMAQTQTLSTVTNVGPTDLFQDIVRGQPNAQNKYATAAQMNAVQGYKNAGTISTDPAYTFTNGITNYFAHASGTVTAVTLTTEPNPGDGKRECYWADAATTTLTWTANTGQAIDSNVHAAGVAYASNCITYVASTAKWYSSN